MQPEFKESQSKKYWTDKGSTLDWVFIPIALSKVEAAEKAQPAPH